MKHTFILSLSLVALSGGAGLGLSALHQSTIPTEVTVLSTPALETGATGFVIPEFVPDVVAPRVATLQTLTAPVSEDDVTFESASLGDLLTTAIEKPITAPIATVATPTQKPRVKRQVVTRSVQPVLTAPRTVSPSAGQQERATAATNRLEYIVGVYR